MAPAMVSRKASSPKVFSLKKVAWLPPEAVSYTHLTLPTIA